MDKTINAKIKNLRQQAGLSQEEVAKRIGMKNSTYSQMERNGRITCEKLIQIAQALEVDVNFVLFETETPKKEINIEEQLVSVNLNNREHNVIKMFRSLSNKKKVIAYEMLYNIMKEEFQYKKAHF